MDEVVGSVDGGSQGEDRVPKLDHYRIEEPGGLPVAELVAAVV